MCMKCVKRNIKKFREHPEFGDVEKTIIDSIDSIIQEAEQNNWDMGEVLGKAAVAFEKTFIISQAVPVPPPEKMN